jgi:hypothetical protein
MWYTLCQKILGNLQTTVNTLNVTTSSVAVPSITTSKTALDFSFVEQNFNSAPLNYQITALNLVSDVTVISGNFTISKAALQGLERI